MITITVCTNKGGVGKTTTSINLLDYLTAQGLNCLGVDLDPQGNLSKTTGIKNPVGSAKEFLLNKNDFPIYRSRGFDVVPADQTLSEVEQKIFTRYNSHTILQQKLRTLEGLYDYCILDCSSHIDIITQNALVSANMVLCPIAPEGWSFDGFEKIEAEIEAIKGSGLNNDLHIAAVIIHKYHGNYILHQEIFKEFTEREYPLFTVSENIAVSEAQYTGTSLFDSAPTCQAAGQLTEIFNTLIKEK